MSNQNSRDAEAIVLARRAGELHTPYVAIDGIPYGSRRHEHFSLYARDWKRQQRPVVVWIPGAWRQPKDLRVYPTVARALVEDGMAVAIPEYSLAAAAWPQQQIDLQRALTQICREIPVLGGDTQRLVLAGDGLGAFMAFQLMLAMHQEAGISSVPAKLCGWMALDGVWQEESLQAFDAKHVLRQVIKDEGNWAAMRPLTVLRPGLSPGFVVHTPPASTMGTEEFAFRALALGNDITLLQRTESGSRILREINRPNHPLRFSWRAWLRRVTRMDRTELPSDTQGGTHDEDN